MVKLSEKERERVEIQKKSLFPPHNRLKFHNAWFGSYLNISTVVDLSFIFCKNNKHKFGTLDCEKLVNDAKFFVLAAGDFVTGEIIGNNQKKNDNDNIWSNLPLCIECSGLCIDDEKKSFFFASSFLQLCISLHEKLLLITHFTTPKVTKHDFERSWKWEKPGKKRNGNPAPVKNTTKKSKNDMNTMTLTSTILCNRFKNLYYWCEHLSYNNSICVLLQNKTKKLMNDSFFIT